MLLIGCGKHAPCNTVCRKSMEGWRDAPDTYKKAGC